MDVQAYSRDGLVRVEFINLGEGFDGDYDPTDPEDVNLLRFDSAVRLDGSSADERGLEAIDETWGLKADGSYCTYIPADTDPDTLLALARLIADRLAEALGNGNWKRTAEEMSYAATDWVTEGR